MTDYYKISLEILSQILKTEGYDHWDKWMQEDIKLWETTKSVEHHLHAYGGMGSFNDVVIGYNDTEGLWKGRVFGGFQSIAYGLASGDSLEIILDRMQNNSHIISGWRCLACGNAKITTKDVEVFIASNLIPKLFVEYINKNQLPDLVAIDKILVSETITNQRNTLKNLISNAGIDLSEDTNWQWNCPKCGSTDTCSYRWELLENDSQIVDAKDNLPLKN
jgi:predicted nucleic-acid-binding Zn-ribbon protein